MWKVGDGKVRKGKGGREDEHIIGRNKTHTRKKTKYRRTFTNRRENTRLYKNVWRKVK